VSELDKASEPWGVKVLRYEIKNITPPRDVIAAMEKQMRAEREKRATVLSSEAERDAAINVAKVKSKMPLKCQKERSSSRSTRRGQAAAILAVAMQRRKVFDELQHRFSNPGEWKRCSFGSESYIGQFGHLAKTNNTMIIPASLTDVSSMIASAMTVIKQTNPTPPPPASAAPQMAVKQW